MSIRFLTLVVTVSAALCSSAQEIAITFDDAPTHTGFLLSGPERARRILQALRENDVKQVAFFVITSNISDDESKSRIKKYIDAGHLIGNHTHSHQWIQEIGVQTYCRDIAKADSILKQYSSYRPWFRYPFLNEGGTKEERDSIRSQLQRLNLSNGYVTIDNYDWYINNLLRDALVAKKKVDYEALKKMYIDHVWSSIRFYDAIASKTLNRSPRHVLLLHENDLSALFIGDLIKHLKNNGWKIISPDLAYKDPIATQVPDVLFNNQGRVAAIARSLNVPAKELVQDSEDEAYLKGLVQKAFQ